MEHLLFERALAGLDVHPDRMTATFIFADDKPNMNKQGLPFSEFQAVADSAIGMPVKLRFTGFDVENHEGSIPVGVIRDMEIRTISDDHHQLVATATLWKDEYPEELAWLKKQFDLGKAPGISYEINYKDFDRIDDVQWLKEAFAGAATFVKTPAYGTRTSLIALASVEDKTKLEHGIIALAEQLINDTKGGNQMTEEELNALKAERDTFKTEASTKQSEIERLMGELTAKQTELDTAINENNTLKQNALVDSRIRSYTEAGFTLEAEAEKVDSRKSLFATFSDEQFEAYLNDLKALKAAAPAPAGGVALASLRKTNDLPRPEVVTEPTGISELAKGLRALARPHEVIE